jgi:hypothetical protein
VEILDIVPSLGFLDWAAGFNREEYTKPVKGQTPAARILRAFLRLCGIFR